MGVRPIFTDFYSLVENVTGPNIGDGLNFATLNRP